MKAIYKEEDFNDDYEDMRIINDFLSDPSNQNKYLELLCRLENIEEFKIEDSDLLGCVNRSVEFGFNKIVNVSTTGAIVSSETNFYNDICFKFYRLFIKLAVKDNFKYNPNYLYSKEELRYYINRGMIYPLSYSFENLDYIPILYDEIDNNIDLKVPYLFNSDFINCYSFENNDNDLFKNYFINKLKEKYSIDWMFNEIRSKIEDIFYANYLDKLYFYDKIRECVPKCNKHIKESYEIKDIFNNLIDIYGLTNIKKLEFVTLDNLYDYLVACGNDRNINNDYIVRMMCRLNKYEFDRCIDVIINNNDVESCYKLLNEICDNFDMNSLLKIYNVIVLSGDQEYINSFVDSDFFFELMILSGNQEYINNIIDSDVISNDVKKCFKKLVRR